MNLKKAFLQVSMIALGTAALSSCTSEKQDYEEKRGEYYVQNLENFNTYTLKTQTLENEKITSDEIVVNRDTFLISNRGMVGIYYDDQGNVKIIDGIAPFKAEKPDERHVYASLPSAIPDTSAEGKLISTLKKFKPFDTELDDVSGHEGNAYYKKGGYVKDFSESWFNKMFDAAVKKGGGLPGNAEASSDALNPYGRVADEVRKQSAPFNNDAITFEERVIPLSKLRMTK